MVISLHRKELFGRDFFTFDNVKRNRTNNYIESYHAKLKLTFESPTLSLGEWIVKFREKHDQDDSRLESVMLGNENPPEADQHTIDADERISDVQADFSIAIEGADANAEEVIIE